ncbi:MAG: hypothetical protein E7464_02865, partial [Ruminococcaceae bacterium]|nr:hypothetical protein [Oscillospiraceae bacterium]
MKSNGKRILAVLLCLVMLLGMLPATTVLAADAPIKVACVGDSITYGHNPASPSGTPRILDDNWTTLLGEELGDGYEVQNFGISGTTVMKAGDRPYWNEGAFTQSKNYQPDIVILMLGTNDSKPSNWSKKDQFDDDLKALIEAYQSLDSKPKVYVATSATAYNDGAFSIVPSVVSDEIVPIQKQVAKEMGCRVIDIHAATADMAANFPDNIHPNVAGHAAIFEAMYEGLTAKIKIACIGDSITYGHNPASPSGNPRITENWPKILGDMLGDGYDVRNFGRNGTTLSRNGQISVWNNQEFTDSKNFNPDIVIIKLGTNDYGNTGTYSATLKELIQVYRDLPSEPEVYIATCAMPYEPGAFGIQCGPIINSIVPQQKAVAEEVGCGLIDVHAATADMPENFPDYIHPNVDGHRVIAETVYATLVSANGCDHEYESVVTEATCTEGGFTTKTCTLCGLELTTSVVPALGHDWDDGVITKAPTNDEDGEKRFTCTRCDETYTKVLLAYGKIDMSDIDFTKPGVEDRYTVDNQTSTAIRDGQGLYLITTTDSFEPCNGQISTFAPKDVVKLLVTGDWQATMKFNFSQGSAANGYYQFFGFYAAEGDDYQNLAGIRGGDGAMQNFLRVDGNVTADTQGVNSEPGLASNGTYWWKLEKSGTTYICYRSADGEAFTEMFRYEDTGIEADSLIIDAYTGMTAGYEFIVESIDFETDGEPMPPPPCEHSYEAVVTDPTCTEGGYTTYTCSKCGESYVADETAKLGHKYKDGICTVCGEKDPNYVPDEPAEGEYVLADSIEAGKSYVLVADGQYALNNTAVTYGSYGNGTDTLGSTPVTIEGDKIVGEVDESLLWTIELGEDVPASPIYDEVQYFLYDCDGNQLMRRSGSSGTAPLQAGGSYSRIHYVTISFYERADGSYTVFFNTDRTDDYPFSFSGSASGFNAPGTQQDNWTPETYGSSIRLYELAEGSDDPVCEHEYEEKVLAGPSCEAFGVVSYTCTKCGHSYEEEYAPLGHDYEEVVTKPTCTEKGYTTYTCSVCGDSYKDDETDALGHKWDGGVVTKEATKEEEGVRTFTCTVCDETKTEAIPKLKDDHVHDYKTVVTAPTCTERGYTTYTCSCGDSYKADYVDVIPHDYKDGVCTVCGAKDESFHDCPAKNFSDIPAKDHWAHPGIDYAVANELMNGTGGDKFSPEGTLTRA